MKRRVKEFKRNKGKSYSYFWIGYQERNAKGTPCFVREINVTGLPLEQIKQIDMALRAGADPMVFKGLVRYQSSVNIGGAWATLRLCEDLGICAELEPRLSGSHFAAVVAMLADRVANAKPQSKLALSRTYPDSALARIMGKREEPLNQWYTSLDELYANQGAIEAALMRRADIGDTVFMYDITSIYFEGTQCPLAKFGYNRDKKKGKLQIVVGMLTNSEGRPLGVKVFEGNTQDASTVLERMRQIKAEYKVGNFIFVGDRGMVTSAVREAVAGLPDCGVDYITALTRQEIMKLANRDERPLDPSLLDKELVEFEDSGVRYVLCHNPVRAAEDGATRLRLVEKTEGKLKKLQEGVAAGRCKKEKVIAKRLHAWLNRWGMGKCFKVDYGEGRFSCERDQARIDELAKLDGCYVVTTTVDKSLFDAEEVVRRYKSLTWVEQVFRHMKTTDEFTRPIRHWTDTRVRGHVFMCMLAYLVIWQARRSFAAFLERDKKTCMCEGGSLREIWDALDAGVSIGTVDMAGTMEDHLSIIPQYQKQLLKAINASINGKEKERLGLVG